MKKSILLFALSVAAALLLAGCGQSQTGAQMSADSTSVSSSIGDTEDASQSSPQFPENLPDASAQPSETDQSAEKTDGSGASSQGQEQTGDTLDAGASEGGDVSAPPPANEPPAADPPAVESPASSAGPEQTPPAVSEPEAGPEPETEQEPDETSTSNTTLSGTNLTLRFGGGESFTIHMYDNPTANKIAEYVGTAAWQLPIYHFDDYDGWESFQYYDIPRRYDIPDGSQSVSSEKARAVYYSHPNRIVLFYHDGEISGEYALVGHFDATEEFVAAVKNNPVLEGWGNKIVSISPGR